MSVYQRVGLKNPGWYHEWSAVHGFPLTRNASLELEVAVIVLRAMGVRASMGALEDPWTFQPLRWLQTLQKDGVKSNYITTSVIKILGQFPPKSSCSHAFCGFQKSKTSFFLRVKTPMGTSTRRSAGTPVEWFADTCGAAEMREVCVKALDVSWKGFYITHGPSCFWTFQRPILRLLEIYSINLYLGDGFKYILFSPPTWGNDPIWLIFFKGVETANQYFIYRTHDPLLTWFVKRKMYISINIYIYLYIS